jgi:hypothetical protein
MRVLLSRAAVLLTGLAAVASITVATAPPSAAGPNLVTWESHHCEETPGCDIEVYTGGRWHHGWFLYGSHVIEVTWPDGHWEYFVIGTDGAMYRLRQGTTYGFVYMGGQFADTLRADITNNQPTVAGLTLSDNVWCFSYYSSDWHLWNC